MNKDLSIGILPEGRGIGRVLGGFGAGEGADLGLGQQLPLRCSHRFEIGP
jgi:hypothetical protein